VILHDTDSVRFSRPEALDCTKTGQGCKGYNRERVDKFHYQPIPSQQDPVEAIVVLKENDLRATPRMCEQGVDEPGCLVEKPLQATAEVDPVVVISKSETKEEAEQEVVELRHFFFCMIILFASNMVLWCRLSIVLVLLGCCVLDQIVQWGSLVQCSKPIHAWLLATYACACALRLAFRSADRYLGIASSDLPWYLQRSKLRGPFPQAYMAAWVLVPLPFVTYWSILGITWLNDVLENSPDSLYNSNGHAHVAVVVTCLIFNLLAVLAGLVFVLYACIVSRSFAAAGDALNAISDADLVERWGPVQPMLAEDFGSGLSPSEIACLPCDEVLSDCAPCCATNCAICLTNFAKQDRIRRLPNCKHEFHRPCIDQWLLRVASCPLCMAPVTGGSSCGSSMSSNSVAEPCNDRVTREYSNDIV